MPAVDGLLFPNAKAWVPPTPVASETFCRERPAPTGERARHRAARSRRSVTEEKVVGGRRHDTRVDNGNDLSYLAIGRVRGNQTSADGFDRLFAVIYSREAMARARNKPQRVSRTLEGTLQSHTSSTRSSTTCVKFVFAEAEGGQLVCLHTVEWDRGPTSSASLWSALETMHRFRVARADHDPDTSQNRCRLSLIESHFLTLAAAIAPRRAPDLSQHPREFDSATRGRARAQGRAIGAQHGTRGQVAANDLHRERPMEEVADVTRGTGDAHVVRPSPSISASRLKKADNWIAEAHAQGHPAALRPPLDAAVGAATADGDAAMLGGS